MCDTILAAQAAVGDRDLRTVWQSVSLSSKTDSDLQIQPFLWHFQFIISSLIIFKNSLTLLAKHFF
jgi:hypothetical protein